MRTEGFKSLIAWQKSLSLVEAIYQYTKSFPAKEGFGLTSQLQRASVSILANIAEGYARDSKPEFRRFLAMSLGSAAEVEALLVVALKLGYITESEFALLDAKRSEVAKLITGLRNSVH